MEWNLKEMTGPEATGWNMDRLVTTEIKTGGRPGRGIMLPLYEAAVKANGNKPISLTIAQKLLELFNNANPPADGSKLTAFIMCGMGAMPFMPCGETDGPPGVASLARAISIGLKGLPVIVAPTRDYESTKAAVAAAGLAVLPEEEALITTARCAVVLKFTETGDNALTVVRQWMDKYQPKAVMAVEMFGPNRKGVKHFGSGRPVERLEKFPKTELFFEEALKRGVFSVGCVDVGNEMGCGNIEEAVRKHTPFADVCNVECKCQDGLAAHTKVSVCFPACVSNWAAYAITAMVGFLVQRPDVLQDDDTERQVLIATASKGSVDGCMGAPYASADGIPGHIHGCFVQILREIATQALSGASIAGQISK
jgi:D-glutamate cyclase